MIFSNPEGLKCRTMHCQKFVVLHYYKDTRSKSLVPSIIQGRHCVHPWTQVPIKHCSQETLTSNGATKVGIKANILEGFKSAFSYDEMLLQTPVTTKQLPRNSRHYCCYHYHQPAENTPTGLVSVIRNHKHAVCIVLLPSRLIYRFMGNYSF